MYARVRVEGRELSVDLSRPLDLALELNFAGAQPRHFGAPRASAQEFAPPGSAFNGSVARGASCNCEVITLIPHCNGTHTECAGHLTRERLDAWRVAPTGLTPALLLSVVPEPAAVEEPLVAVVGLFFLLLLQPASTITPATTATRPRFVIEPTDAPPPRISR